MAELMRNHTTMRVGGPAEQYIEPNSEEDLIAGACEALRSGRQVFLLGNGSNVIVRDGGFAGAVFSTTSALSGILIDMDENTLRAGAGATLSSAARSAAKAGLTGLEELSGIPGTVGGAVLMNAGAYDRDISGCVNKVRVYDLVDEKYIMFTNEACQFAYRTSIFKISAPRYLILDAEFSLAADEPEAISERMEDFTRRRNERQPVEWPSSGSFFKRPPGDFAARLIDEAGLKGYSVGGAQISPKHAGFIVNTGGATAADVLSLAEAVQARVHERFGVNLEPEPVIIGDA
ncbi:MAG: UDP-N-acetylmuramate dehydrogenase [Clostridiales Family XIII bacterium]|jgi:UDP-N-acetylmuramate dehydrogenase|nr:UDP-N-acetylmuramate dehydrogenase [Clostridiales Family XIII bacterium]